MILKFSYTLDGFIEAKDFLIKNRWLEKVRREKFKGFELIAEANRLYELILKGGATVEC